MTLWPVVRIFLSVGFLIWYTEGLICTIGQERDPESGFRYRWVIPEPDPCQCTKLRLGGLNTNTPYRPFMVTYRDTFTYRRDQEGIRTWLNCTDPLLKHLILHQPFAPNGSQGICEGAIAQSTGYTVKGDISLARVVPAPNITDQACAAYTKAGSYLDLGDFNHTCISDPGLCHSMTWSVWLKIDTSSGFSGTRYYISSGGQTSIARGVSLKYISNEKMFSLAVRTVSSQAVNEYNITKIPLDKWFHFAFTIEMNQNAVVTVLKLYIDGEFRLEDDQTMKATSVAKDECTALYLGMVNSCSMPYSSFTYSGSTAYSNLMIFDHLLNKDQIKNLNKQKT